MTETNIHPIEKLNARIRAIVEKETLNHRLWVGGIVRGVYLADSGHIYFTLQDGDYSIRCMLRESNRGSIGFTPQNRMEVEAYGVIRVFEQRATVEIDVEDMRIVQGQVMTNFVPVRERLTKMRLYPPEKQPIPIEPAKIALITGRTSEAYSDFTNAYNRYKHPEKRGAQIIPVDVRLEGEFAPREIADAINQVNREQSADLIVLARGGGRRQALTIFDDFLIAEAICRSHIPIVTGIGHTNDRTFADEIADKDCDTPTDAGTYLAMLSPDQVVASSPTSNYLLYGALIALAVAVTIVLIVLVIVAF